jgi:large subunit ribosomal protein L14e
VPAVEIGRICEKTAGRDAGKKCVIVDVMDKSFVLVTGPKKITAVKRKRVNLNHIKILQDRLDIKRGASDEEVISAIEATGKMQEMSQIAKP